MQLMTSSSLLLLLFFCLGATVYDPTPGTGQIWLDNVQCQGTEITLINCPSNNVGSHNCVHAEDVGVTCLAGKLFFYSASQQSRVFSHGI